MSKEFEEELKQRLEWVKKNFDESFGKEEKFEPKPDQALIDLERSVGHQLNVIELLWYRQNGMRPVK